MCWFQNVPEPSNSELSPSGRTGLTCRGLTFKSSDAIMEPGFVTAQLRLFFVCGLKICFRRRRRRMKQRFGQSLKWPAKVSSPCQCKTVKLLETVVSVKVNFPSTKKGGCTCLERNLMTGVKKRKIVYQKMCCWEFLIMECFNISLFVHVSNSVLYIDWLCFLQS